MNTTRRNFLRGAATGAAVLAVAGSAAAGWRAWDVGLIGSDERPFEPWRALADAAPHDPTGLVAAAILASNPHNTQPWLFAFAPDAITIRAVTERNLGSFDPYLREMWIGLGCATENIVQAAPRLGYRAQATVERRPGENEPVIVVALTKTEPAAAPLFEAISQRRTNRTAYRAEPVPAEAAAKLAAMTESEARVKLFASSSEEGRLFATETLAATDAINADPDMPHDGHHWVRGTAAAIAAHRDGVAISTAGLSPFITIAGQMMPLPDAAASGGYWRASTERQLSGSPMFGVITVTDLYDRRAQVAAGRVWQRLHRAMTAQGLAAQPMNQLPEVVDREHQTGKGSGRTARALKTISGGRGLVTFAFRMGLPESQVPHSARRALAEVIA